MNDKQMIEDIIRNIAASFSGEQSTRDWTEETERRVEGAARAYIHGSRLGRDD